LKLLYLFIFIKIIKQTKNRQYEQVSFLANEAKNYQLTYESIEKAADLMMTDGTRDSAGIILEKAAG